MAAYSPMSSDGLPGLEWCDLTGEVVGQADISPIMPTTPGITLFEIPMRTGASSFHLLLSARPPLRRLQLAAIQLAAKWERVN